MLQFQQNELREKLLDQGWPNSRSQGSSPTVREGAVVDADALPHGRATAPSKSCPALPALRLAELRSILRR